MMEFLIEISMFINVIYLFCPVIDYWQIWEERFFVRILGIFISNKNSHPITSNKQLLKCLKKY